MDGKRRFGRVKAVKKKVSETGKGENCSVERGEV